MSTSSTLFKKAQQFIPGGVNSPVRAFNGVADDPIFISRAKGAYLYDADNKAYIDYVGSWGPMICGHAHPEIISAVKQACDNGLSFGAPTALETELAERICNIMPGMDKIRMTNSGTEATMSAIRLARGYTKRDNFIKFEGCYHGHADSLLVKAGSGALTLGVPTSLGVPAAFAEHTISLEYNNAAQVKEYMSQHGDTIACIIVEPVAGNMNCIPPKDGFLQTLSEQCTKHGAVLIIDEVMTGFRVSLSGAQGYYGVTPDLTTLGKIIGGGMPVGAFGGKAEIMDCIAPTGQVYQAGTLSGNPIAMTAGLKNLDIISRPGFYDELTAKVDFLVAGILAAANKHNIALTANKVGGMFGLFFSEQAKVENFAQATQCDIGQFQQFFNLMLDAGVNLAPSAYEAGFVSSAHSQEILQETIDKAENAFSRMG